MISISLIIISDPLTAFLWSVSCILLIIVSLLYWNLSRKRKERKEDLFLIGFSSYFFCYGVASIIFYMINHFLVPGVYIENVFYGDYAAAGAPFNLGQKIATFIVLIGAAVGVFTFEIGYRKTRYVLTIINLILLIVFIILPHESTTPSLISTILTVFNMLAFLYIMLYNTNVSSIEFRPISAIILFGFLLSFNGNLLVNPAIRAVEILPLPLAYIIFNIGMLILMAPIFIDPKRLASANLYWIISGILLIPPIWLLSIYFLLVGVAGSFIILYLPLTIITSIMYFLTLRIVRFEKKPIDLTSEKANLLTMFTKPQRLTEEEVSVAKEKKICLVCKGNLSGFNIFLCFECGALYCENCARTLSDMENTCWVCEAAFDESKPVKKTTEQEQDLEVGIDSPKNK